MDPSFHFDSVLDTTFQIYADPDLYLVLRPSTAPFWVSATTFWASKALNGSIFNPYKQIRLLNFDFDAAFHSYLEPASQNNKQIHADQDPHLCF